jgi:hypothetical protein
MPCGIGFIQWLSDGGYLPATGRVLDLGESRLLGATPDEIRALLTKHRTKLSGFPFEAACAELSARSEPNGPPFTRKLPLADLFASTGVTYTGLPPKALAIPAPDLGTYDLVLNFGGTAGVLNQFEAFAALHAACKRGGWMFHQLPATGYMGQGFFCYHPPLFDELARANGYTLQALWYSGPLASSGVLDLAARWPGIADGNQLCNDIEGLRAHPVPYSVLNVLLRKGSDAPFRGPSEPPPPPPPPPPAGFPRLVREEQKPSLAYRAARKLYRKIVGPKKGT